MVYPLLYSLSFRFFTLSRGGITHTRTYRHNINGEGRERGPFSEYTANHLVGFLLVDYFQGIGYRVSEKVHQSKSSYIFGKIFIPMDLVPKSHCNKHNDCISFCEGSFLILYNIWRKSFSPDRYATLNLFFFLLF